MSTLFVTPDDQVKEIISHMEADKVSIAPSHCGYIIARDSEEAKKLVLVSEGVQKLDIPYDHYFIVPANEWRRVKDRELPSLN